MVLRKKRKKKNKGFNCLTREKWTEEKTAWCCENEQLGCTVTDACEDKNEDLAAIMMVEGYTCATALDDYESNMCANELFIPYCCKTCSMKEEPSVDCMSERPEPKCEGDTLVTFVEGTADSRGCMIYGREEIVCGMGHCNAEAGQCDEIDGETPIPCNSNIDVDWACMECGGKQGKACTAKAGFGSSDLIEGKCNANYGCAKAEDEISLAGRKKRKKRKGKKKRKNKNKGEESEDSEEEPCAEATMKDGTCCKWANARFDYSDLDNVPDHPEECCEGEVTMNNECPVPEPCAEATMKDGTCCNWANARFDYSDLENVPDHPEECCEGQVTMNNECP